MSKIDQKRGRAGGFSDVVSLQKKKLAQWTLGRRLCGASYRAALTDL